MPKISAQQFPRWEPDRFLGIFNPATGAWSCLGTTQLGRRCRRPLSNASKDELVLMLAGLGSSHPEDPEAEETQLSNIIEASLCRDHTDAGNAEEILASFRLILKRARKGMEMFRGEIIVEEAEYAHEDPSLPSSSSAEGVVSDRLDAPGIVAPTEPSIVTDNQGSNGPRHGLHFLSPISSTSLSQRAARLSLPPSCSTLGSNKRSKTIHKPDSSLPLPPERETRQDQRDEGNTVGQRAFHSTTPKPETAPVLFATSSQDQHHAAPLHHPEEQLARPGSQQDEKVMLTNAHNSAAAIQGAQAGGDEELLELVDKFQLLGRTMDEGEDASLIGKDVLDKCDALGVGASRLYQVALENPDAEDHTIVGLLKQQDLTVTTLPKQWKIPARDTPPPE
ncbi:hypothetical protein OQA88_4801 [Cercophora sp. LCS_1]